MSLTVARVTDSSAKECEGTRAVYHHSFRKETGVTQAVLAAQSKLALGGVQGQANLPSCKAGEGSTDLRDAPREAHVVEEGEAKVRLLGFRHKPAAQVEGQVKRARAPKGHPVAPQPQS